MSVHKIVPVDMQDRVELQIYIAGDVWENGTERAALVVEVYKPRSAYGAYVSWPNTTDRRLDAVRGLSLALGIAVHMCEDLDAHGTVAYERFAEVTF